ncbi:mechanosensitive ion channel family protein [Maricaulis sp.]|uniref:mechanosensitive ion channel family protein n=1 Tax=Maricaulis sp. TaxID=1486257 RepID=UPI000C5553DE|nr:mechanosensitive ion channel family protein [Maricaulis sp.]MAC90732.1 mechanosensitive ion channel protein MscS [Maricaulis sp.]
MTRNAPAMSTEDSLTGQASELWGIAIDVWNSSFLGVSIGQGLLALTIVLIGFVARGMIARWLVGALKRLAEKTQTGFDDAVVDAIAGPMKLVPVIISLFFALNILQIGAEGAVRGHQFVQSLVVIALFWALHNAVGPLSHALKGLRNALTPVMVDWMTKALRIVFMVVGAAAVLQVWDIPVAGIVAGLGLFGVAIGLGAQDLFKNLIAGILILTEKRFLPGDWVKVDGIVEGTVEEINFRSTVVRRFDKGPVYVPNSKLSDNAVTNFTRMTHRRTYWIIGVRYDTTSDQLREIRDKVLGYVQSHPEYAQAPEVSTFMRVDSFGPSSIDFMLYCFTKTTNWGEWLRLKEDLAFFIKETVEAAGTEFAFPSTSVYVESGAEVFSPPGDDGAKAVLPSEAGKG